MAIKQLSDGGSDGTRLGQSSTDKVAFHGATPAAKATCTLCRIDGSDHDPANIAAAFAELYAALAAKGMVG